MSPLTDTTPQDIWQSVILWGVICSGVLSLWRRIIG
jgi:hypothetical protein